LSAFSVATASESVFRRPKKGNLLEELMLGLGVRVAGRGGSGIASFFSGTDVLLGLLDADVPTRPTGKCEAEAFLTSCGDGVVLGGEGDDT
jgi:hypothetical protein